MTLGHAQTNVTKTRPVENDISRVKFTVRKVDPKAYQFLSTFSQPCAKGGIRASALEHYQFKLAVNVYTLFPRVTFMQYLEGMGSKELIDSWISFFFQERIGNGRLKESNKISFIF